MPAPISSGGNDNHTTPSRDMAWLSEIEACLGGRWGPALKVENTGAVIRPAPPCFNAIAPAKVSCFESDAAKGNGGPMSEACAHCLGASDCVGEATDVCHVAMRGALIAPR